MDLILSEEQRLLRDSAAKALNRGGGAKRARPLRNVDGGFDCDRFREMAALGWLGLLVPIERGGLGLGPVELALILEQGGRVLMPEPVAGSAVVAMALGISEDADVSARWLGPVLSGDVIIGLALSCGLNQPNEVPRAATVGGRISLVGAVDVVSAAGVADGFLVGAYRDDGWLLCLVSRGADGVEIDLTPTVDGRPYGTVRFRNSPVDYVISSSDDSPGALDRLYDLSLISASAELLGVMSGAHEMTLDYLRTRRQFDRPIGSFQALQHRAVDNFILIESTRSLLYQACERPEALTSSLASAVKAYASEAALTVTKTAIQLHGAIGFTDEHDVGLYLKRAMWLSAYLGNAAAHRRRYAELAA